MPELPDITVYIEALQQRLLQRTLLSIRINTPFLLRSVAPPPDAACMHRVSGFQRIGKRIAIGFDNNIFLVFHLMIAGRLHWYHGDGKVPPKLPLAILRFDNGTLTLTEAGSKRRASLHVISGEQQLQTLDPGGLEIFEIDLAQFAGRLRLRNHTLKRALTDPHLFSGIGNAYSDEILLQARLSPVAMTQRLTDAEVATLHAATVAVLRRWIDTLRNEANGDFPEKVTAFRTAMSAHGRFGQPCPQCGTPIQRIRYASNETNYCPRCQTGGRMLADRALSRLLKQDWPKTIDELEQKRSS